MGQADPSPTAKSPAADRQEPRQAFSVLSASKGYTGAGRFAARPDVHSDTSDLSHRLLLRVCRYLALAVSKN